MNSSKKENIQLSLPANAAYVSAARLTASSIANRMGFDIDEIEDIKAAVSEACTFIIKKLALDAAGTFTITFELEQTALNIKISLKGFLPTESFNDEMGLVMIKALMDNFDIFNNEDGDLMFKMIKKHKTVSF